MAGITSKESLAFVSRITAQEKTATFEIADTFQSRNTIDNFRACVIEVVLDRLVLAEGCLAAAKRLLLSPVDVFDLRMSIGRAYYAIHHAIRAVALYVNEYDPDSHDGAIQVLRSMLTHNAFAAKSGLQPDVTAQIAEAKFNRHAADNSPYESLRHSPSRVAIGITGADWVTAATFNVALADQVLTLPLRRLLDCRRRRK